MNFSYFYEQYGFAVCVRFCVLFIFFCNCPIDFFLITRLDLFFFFFTRPISVGSNTSFDFSRLARLLRSYVLTISPFLISFGSNETPNFSIASMACSSFGEYNVMAVPFKPLRPVRPTRWIKKSRSSGISALIT